MQAAMAAEPRSPWSRRASSRQVTFWTTTHSCWRSGSDRESLRLGAWMRCWRAVISSRPAQWPCSAVPYSHLDNSAASTAREHCCRDAATSSRTGAHGSSPASSTAHLVSATSRRFPHLSRSPRWAWAFSCTVASRAENLSRRVEIFCRSAWANSQDAVRSAWTWDFIWSEVSSNTLQAKSASPCAALHAACSPASRSCSWALQISSAPMRCFCSSRQASTRLSAATATGREKFVRAETIIRSSTLALNRSWAVWNSRRMAGWISSSTVGSNTSPITVDSCGDNFPPACAKT
mmetsp:Transcript_2550/g.5933  ORF Transcript_2550/g.5933 Transcript_2550/m.5933 type:complete len:292 (-) Transcript_2550:241-1116(-)